MKTNRRVVAVFRIASVPGSAANETVGVLLLPDSRFPPAGVVVILEVLPSRTWSILCKWT